MPTSQHSFTIGAVLKAAGTNIIPGSFDGTSFDHVAFDTKGGGSLTANAVLKKTITSTAVSLSALILRGGRRNLDAILKKHQTSLGGGAFDSGGFDSNAFDAGTGVSLTATLLAKKSSSATSIGARLASSKKLDAILKKTQFSVAGPGGSTGAFDPTAFDFNAFDAGRSPTLDAFLVAHARNVSANAILIAPAATFGVTASAILKSLASPHSLTADAVLLKSTASSAALDGVLLKIGITATVAASAVLQASASTTSVSVSAVLLAKGSSTASLDCFLESLGHVVRPLTIDAFLHKVGQTASATANAVLLRSTAGSVSANATLSARSSHTATADAILRTSGSHLLTASALLKANRVSSVAANAWAVHRQTHTASIDSSLKLRAAAYSVAASAVLVTLSGGLPLSQTATQRTAFTSARLPS